VPARPPARAPPRQTSPTASNLSHAPARPRPALTPRPHAPPSAFAASAAAPARAVTVTELVGALCPDIAGAVTDPKGNLKTLYAALGALGDVDIGEVPASAVILAPTDDAFAAALESLGMTAEELLADTDLLGKIVSAPGARCPAAAARPPLIPAPARSPSPPNPADPRSP
jgi:hypothetical protein